MFNPEYNELKKRYEMLLEQYQRLQGSFKILEATNEELTATVEKTEKERDKYKKAFDEIFTNNIGDEWEKLTDDERKAMGVDEKLSFFENEISLSKLYIRRKMSDQMTDTVEENQRLNSELVMVKAQLEEKETQLANAASLGGVKRNNNIKNSLLDDSETGSSGSTPVSKQSKPWNQAGENNKKEMDKSLLAKIGGILNKAVGGNDQAKPKPQEATNNSKPTPPPANPTPSVKPQQSNNNSTPTENVKPRPETTIPVNATQAEAKVEQPKTQEQPKPQEQPHTTQVKPESNTAHNETPQTPTPKEAPQAEVQVKKPQTTGFFKRFKQAPPALQEKFKQQLPVLDKMLGEIPSGKEIITVIGNTGLYVHKEIFQEGINCKYWQAKDDQRIRNAEKALIEKGFIVNGTEIKQLTRGRPTQTHMLSPAGEAWYALTTLKDPLKSLFIVRAKEQKSVEHAELIQRMIKILKDSGYETVQEAVLKTSSTGKESIADISAHKGEFINIRIECEMGNYDIPSYIYKFTKVLEVTDRLLVGVPTNTEKKKIEEAIGEMIREQYKGIDNFYKAGKYYKVFTLQELTDNPDLILPQKKNGRR